MSKAHEEVIAASARVNNLFSERVTLAVMFVGKDF
jgi:hypothetical protein